ncbi:MAG TPA: TRAP transporter substrate-binding protein DctP [Gammaproteobacteria bacterium]|nr:TRAP transporter substrate-binding protein DctP [Gammaproteobacteria bacterium]
MIDRSGLTRFSRRCIGVAAALALCIGTLLAGGPAGAAETELKLATIAPDGSHWMREMRAAADEVKTKTAGRVVIKFYPGGVMGNDAQVLRKVRIGQLQGGAFTSSGLAERFSGLNLYGIPLLFRSLDEVDFVRKHMDPVLDAGLRKAGFVSFGFVEGGFAQLMSKTPVSSVEDMRRRKVWVPDGDQISFLAMESLGLSPVVLPVTDVLTGLQTGLLDIVAASPVAALVLQWHTKISYMTDLPVVYSMGVVAVDERAWSGISADDQRVLSEVLGKTVHELDRAAREDNAKAQEALEAAGVKIVRVDDDRRAELRKQIEAIYPQLEQRPDVDGALFKKERELLAQYRSTHPALAASD